MYVCICSTNTIYMYIRSYIFHRTLYIRNNERGGVQRKAYRLLFKENRWRVNEIVAGKKSTARRYYFSFYIPPHPLTPWQLRHSRSECAANFSPLFASQPIISSVTNASAKHLRARRISTSAAESSIIPSPPSPAPYHLHCAFEVTDE